jgi:predicted O-linked N-acetylglucosamine transferase (SPINDLY family)
MKPVWGLINHHDRAKVEVHLFSDAPRSAVKYGYPKDSSIRFHDISGYANDGAARLIAKNQIDVLVDLNGFSTLNRLPLFLKRPAPLLVAWFNIFATSGMGCFDVLIGDEWVIREDEERWFVEKVVKLPMSYLTFDVNYPVPEVQPPPCMRNGFITFGSLASLYKINAKVIGAWAEILRRCPSSRLVLRNAQLKYQHDREHTLNRLVAGGISGERVTLLGPGTHYDFLKQYASIDLALDPFPYNGGTTTTEAIWQGVPVLTFCGDRWISRTSASILCNAGLKQFVRKDLEDYIERAAHWGSSPEAPLELRDLRTGMRAQLQRSPVCDCGRFAEQMEEIYRSAYQSLLKDSGV